jgi:hypothetical protein
MHTQLLRSCYDIFLFPTDTRLLRSRETNVGGKNYIPFQHTRARVLMPGICDRVIPRLAGNPEILLLGLIVHSSQGFELKISDTHAPKERRVCRKSDPGKTAPSEPRCEFGQV